MKKEDSTMTQELTNDAGAKLFVFGTLSIDASGIGSEKVRIAAQDASGKYVTAGMFSAKKLVDVIRAEVSKDTDFVTSETKARIEELETRLKKADEALALKDENIERLSVVMRRQETALKEAQGAEPKTIEDYLNAIRELAKTPEYQVDAIEQGDSYVRISAGGEEVAALVAPNYLKAQPDGESFTRVPLVPKKKEPWEDDDVINAQVKFLRGAASVPMPLTRTVGGDWRSATTGKTYSSNELMNVKRYTLEESND